MKTIAIAAIAGFAAAASAQSSFSLSIVGAPMTVDTTMGAATFTVDVTGDSDFGTHILGGGFALSTGSSANVTAMSWANAAWSAFNTDGGYDGAGNYNNVIFGQLVIPGIFPPAAGSELGSVIGSFQITVEGAGVLDLSLVAAAPFALEAVDSVSGATANSSNGSLTLGGASVNLVPAPSAMALLGLGGLAAGRRRR
jgi:hypothetical protein